MRNQAYTNRSKAATRTRCWRQPLRALGVNELTIKQRERIVRLVRDGLSFRSIERITGHRRETISRYAREAGDGKRNVTTAPLLDAFERTIVLPEGSTRERAVA